MTATRIFAYLRQLLDVNTTGATDGQVLTFDEGTETWIPGNGGGGGGGSAATRYASATVLSGNSSVTITLGVGETVGGVPCQQRSNSGVQFQGVDYSGLNATLQFTGTVDSSLALLVPIKLA